MSTKLMLTLDKEIIEKAKRYAKHSNQSLSDLVESYLEKLTSFEGLFGSVTFPVNIDHKQAIRTILTDKHIK
ncbi:MAG: DUF6364 family protein [Tunicatimonas sp.]|uniref:DUF6364 family protein n=1 Tax=Tunicatimonas sp. TaxID=1940096 RepID=UPI003C70EFDB